MKKQLWAYLPAIYIVFVFVQSLFFKFSGAAESIYIFQTIEDWSGLGFFEPVMRILVGSGELIASILLLIPGTQVLGALLALGIISGAIFFHLFSPLGVVVHNDGGLLFMMALGVFAAALYILYVRKNQLCSLTRTLTPYCLAKRCKTKHGDSD